MVQAVVKFYANLKGQHIDIPSKLIDEKEEIFDNIEEAEEFYKECTMPIDIIRDTELARVKEKTFSKNEE